MWSLQPVIRPHENQTGLPAGHHVRLPAPTLALEHCQQAQSASTQQILDSLQQLSKVGPPVAQLLRLLAVALNALGCYRSWSRLAAGNTQAPVWCGRNCACSK